GVRQHWAVAPWAPRVELHFGHQGEAYVTPLGPREIGIAYLFEPGAQPELDAFPQLATRLRGAAPTSRVLGAGPLARRARHLALDRLVLLGDAGGYVDAITGEGLSLAFASALELAHLLPSAIAAGAGAETFAPW